MAQVVTWGVGAPEPAAVLDGAAGMRALAASGAHQVRKPPLVSVPACVQASLKQGGSMGGRICDAWLACCAALIQRCSMTLECAFLLPAHQLVDSASSAYHMHGSHCARLHALAALPGHCGRACAACAARADPPRTWGWRRT